MKRLAAVLSLAACLMGTEAMAVNSVVVESKTVYQGKSTSVGIAITNDVPLSSILIPLVIRSLDSGSFITALTPQRTPGGRLASVLTGINTNNTYPREDGTCYVDRPGGLRISGAVDGISPDGAKFVAGRIAPADTPLQPGTDPVTGSLQLLMAVNSSAGRLEVDTTCCNPSCHIVFVNANTGEGVLPSFTKGIITIEMCDCPSQGDVNGDGVIDVFDVIGVIGIAFSSEADPQDPICPNTRGDSDGNGVTDVFDVMYLINTAFGGGPDPVNPCLP